MRPVKGVNYQPSPSDYNTLPAPFVYGDTDFWNQDFSALWSMVGNQGGEVGRNDVNIMSSTLNATLIKGFNYADPNNRNHKPFLAYCQQHNLKVLVPLSNFFINPTNVVQFADVIIRIIKEASSEPAVVGFTIGNELNDTDNAAAIAQAFKLITENDTRGLVCCSPLQNFDGTGSTYPQMATDIKTAITAIGLTTEYNNRWFQAVNLYPLPSPNPPTDYTYLTKFITETHPTSAFSDEYLLITEYGWYTNPPGGVPGQTGQDTSVQEQAKIIYNNATNTSYPKFLGGCYFEWSDELYKPGSSEKSFGLQAFPSPLDFTIGKTTNNLDYRIDVYDTNPSFTTLASIFKNP